MMPMRHRRSKHERDLDEARKQLERYNAMLRGDKPATESRPAMIKAREFWNNKVHKLESEE